MKISNIETTLVDAKYHSWLIVKIGTDEGIIGIGEASLEGRSATVATAISELARYLIGKNPCHIERHFQHAYRGLFWRGGPVLMSAFSGVEQALWDIFGKSLNQPVYNLLGGPVRDRIKLYANGWMGGVQSVDEAAKKAQLVVSRGFKALKMGGYQGSTEISGKASYRWGLECARAIRKAVGPEIELMVDMHSRTTTSEAIALAREYAKIDIYFFEEPVEPENISGLKEVRQQGGVRVAAGERLFTRFGFRDVIERQAVDIIQPDLCHCGGILEAKKIAAMAEAYGVRVAPHNSLSFVSTSACVQFAACTHNFDILEYFVEDVPWREELFPRAWKVEDGYIIPSSRPGLGIDFNENVASRHPFNPVDQPMIRLPDGTVAEE